MAIRCRFELAPGEDTSICSASQQTSTPAAADGAAIASFAVVCGGGLAYIVTSPTNRDLWTAVPHPPRAAGWPPTSCAGTTWPPYWSGYTSPARCRARSDRHHRAQPLDHRRSRRRVVVARVGRGTPGGEIRRAGRPSPLVAPTGGRPRYSPSSSVDSIAVATAGLEGISTTSCAWPDPVSVLASGTVQDLAKLAEPPRLAPLRSQPRRGRGRRGGGGEALRWLRPSGAQPGLAQRAARFDAGLRARRVGACRWPTRPTWAPWPSTAGVSGSGWATSSTCRARSASAPGSSTTASRCSGPPATPARSGTR